MQRELLVALSTGWVERTLGVSRATVATWRQGKFPEHRQAQLEQAVRALLDIEKEAPPPQWATGLIEDMVALRRLWDSVGAELAAIRAVVEANASPPRLPPGDQAGGPMLPRTGRRRGR